MTICADACQSPGASGPKVSHGADMPTWCPTFIDGSQLKRKKQVSTLELKGKLRAILPRMYDRISR
jgi:hypothetical protein